VVAALALLDTTQIKVFYDLENSKTLE